MVPPSQSSQSTEEYSYKGTSQADKNSVVEEVQGAGKYRDGAGSEPNGGHGLNARAETWRGSLR